VKTRSLKLVCSSLFSLFPVHTVETISNFNLVFQFRDDALDVQIFHARLILIDFETAKIDRLEYIPR
jgi:hypothetical protein